MAHVGRPPRLVGLGLTSWGFVEDHLAVGSHPIELIYPPWDGVRGEVERAYEVGLVGAGFTTAVLYTVAHGRPLHDPSGPWASCASG